MKHFVKKYGFLSLVTGWLFLSFVLVCPYLCPQAQAEKVSSHCASHNQSSYPEGTPLGQEEVCCDHSFDVFIQTSSVDHSSSPHLFQLGSQPVPLSGDLSDFGFFKPQLSSYFTFSPQTIKIPLHLLNRVLLN